MNRFPYLKSNLKVKQAKTFYFGLAIIFLSLLPGSIKKSLWMDDYPFLWGTLSNDPEVIEFMLSSSRPILAFFTFIISQFSFNFFFYSYLKLIGFMGVAFTYFLIATRWNRLHYQSFMIPIAALALCLPTFQTYTFWASAFTYSWAPGLSIISLNLWEQKHNKLRFLAVLIFSMSFLIYPPGAFFCFGLIAVEYWMTKRSTESMARETYSVCLLASIGTSLALIIFYSYLNLLELSSSQRNELVRVGDLPRKLSWYLSRVILSSLRPFQISSPNIFEAILTLSPMIICFALGIYKRLQIVSTKFFPHILMLFLPLFISSFHILVLKENQFEFRFFPGQMWATFVIASYFFLDIIKHKLQTRLSRQFLFFVASFISIIVIAKTNSVFDEVIKRPFDIKTQYLKNLISECNLKAQNAAIVFKLLPTKQIFLNNLGSYSISLDSHYDWVLRPELNLLKTLSKSYNSSNVEQSFKTGKSQFYQCQVSVKEIERHISDSKH